MQTKWVQWWDKCRDTVGISGYTWDTFEVVPMPAFKSPLA